VLVLKGYGGGRVLMLVVRVMSYCRSGILLLVLRFIYPRYVCECGGEFLDFREKG
jgi:hypothetical protein